MKGKILSLSVTVYLLTGMFIHAYAVSTVTDTVNIRDVYNPGRITGGDYKIAMYVQKDKALSNISILDRQVVKTTYNSVPAILITEMNWTRDSRIKTVLYIDARTLAPLYMETGANDTVKQKVFIEPLKSVIHSFSNGAETVKEMEIPADVFSSSSFSELVESNDFGKNRIVRFSTFSPGFPANIFTVENIGERQITIMDKKIDCWALRFTQKDNTGKSTPLGIRLIDKKSGKIVYYKTSDGPNFFTYQLLFIQ